MAPVEAAWSIALRREALVRPLAERRLLARSLLLLVAGFLLRKANQHEWDSCSDRLSFRFREHDSQDRGIPYGIPGGWYEERIGWVLLVGYLRPLFLWPVRLRRRRESAY
jgi:hypothetical protein